MISLENLCCEIDGHTIISNVSLTINEGEHVVLTGSSGAGKSSLMKALIGARTITSGEIQINGTTLTETTITDIRAQIAYIPQEPILGATTVEDALRLPFTFKQHDGKAPSSQIIHDTLSSVDLDPEILRKDCSSISGGEKQRIAIARALLLNKTIIFADEVTSALDPQSKESVMELLFRPELTIVSVSHDRDWVDRCTRNIVMEKGAIKHEARNERND